MHVLEFEYQRMRMATFIEAFASVLAWPGPPTAYQASVAGDWVRAVPEFVVPASLEDADVAMLPFDLEACSFGAGLYDKAVQLASQARDAGKVVLAFCQGDVEFAPPGPNCVVFRTSSSRRALGRQDVMMPAWVADPADKIELQVRPWAGTPKVNFVGQAYPLGIDFGGPVKTAVKWSKALGRAAATAVGAVGRFGKSPMHLQRAAAVAALQRARGVEADIVLRESMVRLELEEPDTDALHMAYLRRLAESDYTLAVRGFGNYSYRLYESLAVGRPVVSVRTDDVRPCAHDVPWERISIDVPVRRLPWIGSAVRDGHQSRRAEWIELQQLCRGSWLESLSAPGYFRRLARRVSALASRGPLTPETIAAELA